MICFVFFISVNDCSAFTQSKNFQIVGFEHPNIELKARCQPSAIFVERGKRLRPAAFWFHISCANVGRLPEEPIHVASSYLVNSIMSGGSSGLSSLHVWSASSSGTDAIAPTIVKHCCICESATENLPSG